MGTTACAKCARNCLLIHGKNQGPSPVVQSFFKILTINFSEVLFLPPKISQMMPDLDRLVGKKTQLEDTSGKRWPVTLSWQEDSLVFHRGWSSFSQAHGLEFGDLLVFRYHLGSHFVVEIYGINGCERLHFSAESGSWKKRRTNTPSGAEDGKDHSTHCNSMGIQGQVASSLSGSNKETVTDNDSIIPRNCLNEEQWCMIGMDARHGYDDHRNSLYDLPNFEMQKTSDVGGTAAVLEHERSPCHGNRMLTPQAGEEVVDRVPAAEKVVAPDVQNLEACEANEDFEMTEKVVLVSTKNSGNGNTIGQVHHEKTKSTGEKIKEAKTKQLEMETEVCGSRDVVMGKYPEPKDSGYRTSNHLAGKEDHVFKAIQTEPVDTFDSPSADSSTISSMVIETKAFLELPSRLPCVKAKFPRVDPTNRRAVVLLQDPKSRLWPVFYNERSIIKALTGGWEVFLKENSIQPGDECAFEVENKDEGIYKVSIVRK